MNLIYLNKIRFNEINVNLDFKPSLTKNTLILLKSRPVKYNYLAKLCLLAFNWLTVLLPILLNYFLAKVSNCIMLLI